MKKKLFDLNLLRALDALLEEENVTRAAEALCVTQQAMSGSLARLRDHFEDQLLTRVGRGLQLTPLARSLVQPVREAILRAEIALETRPDFEPSSATHVIRIVMSDYATLVFLPQFLRRLSQQAPNISVIVSNISPKTMHELEAGEIDMCMTVGDWTLFPNFRHVEEMRTARIFSDSFVCVVDRNHPTVGDHLTLEQYVQLRHCAVFFGPTISAIVESAWRSERLPIRVSATAPSFASQLFMLPGTNLIATAQRKLANVLAPTLGLRTLECPINIEPLQETLLWHPRQDDAPAHEFVRRLIIATAAELDESTAHN